MASLVVSNVEIMYAGIIWAVRGVSLEVGEGQIVTLLGANGAGKSTTLKAISGLLELEEGKVTTGSITYADHHIENGAPETISKLGIIQVMEGRPVFEHLTVEQNLLASAHNAPSNLRKNLEMVYELFPKLQLLKNHGAGYVSGGEQQMLCMGRALMATPKVLLLDEPSLGLAPLLIEEIYTKIKGINMEQKVSILLVEQNARVALDIADYGYVMESGKIVLDGSADKLKDNEDVKEFYLGLSGLGEKRRYKDVKHYKRRKRWL